MKSKIISISAITSALVALVLSAGVFFEFVDLFALAISSAIVLLPLYYKSYLGSLLSVLCGGLVALIFTGFNFFSIVFPAFFGYFGTFPILACYLREKRFNIIAYKIIGLIWCVASFFGIYYYYTFIMNVPFNDLPSIVSKYIYWFVLLASVIFYFVFDRYILVSKLFINRYVSRIISRDK